MYIRNYADIRPGQIFYIGGSPFFKEGNWKKASLSTVWYASGGPWTDPLSANMVEKTVPIGAPCMVLTRAGEARYAEQIAYRDSTRKEYYVEVLYEGTVYYAHIAILWSKEEMFAWGTLPANFDKTI